MLELLPAMPVRRTDQLLGSLLHTGDELRYGEGQVLFVPSNDEIEIFVDGEAQGNLNRQHVFWTNLCQDGSSFSQEIGRKLRERSRLDPHQASFVVTSISVGASPLATAEWESSLALTSGPLYSYVFTLKGCRVAKVSRDC